ncbi:MAG: hypothetical protein R6U68_17245 [Desulfobacteraceae bacterium]
MRLKKTVSKLAKPAKIGFKILLLILIMSLGLPDDLRAWFSSVRDADSLNPGEMVQLDKTIQSFVVYDNFTLSGETGKDIRILPASPSFVPADRIDVKIPLILFERPSMTTMQSLDRLLAANIRLRQLLKEHEQLRQRAEKLLKSVSIPYLDGYLFKASRKITPGITEQKKALEKQIAHTAIAVKGPLTRDKTSAIVDFSHIQSHLLTRQKINALNRSDASDRSDGNLSYYHLAGADKEKNTPSVPGTATYPGPKPESDLPWLFKFCIDLVSYIISHRVETLFYVSLLFILVWFVSLKVK